jgi:HlyD family secretion protein
MRWDRHIVLGFIIAAMVLVIGYGFMTKSMSVNAVDITHGPLQVTITEEGKTRVIDRFVISAPVAGLARRIDLDVGDMVTEGQIVAHLDPLPSEVLDPRSRAEAMARVAAAQAALHAAREKARAAIADATYWGEEIKRMYQLHKKGLASHEALDKALAQTRHTQASRRSSEFSVEVARHELEAAQTTLRYSAAEENPQHVPEQVAIKATVMGQVLKIVHESAGIVTGGQALLEIGDPHSLEIEVEVLSADAVRMHPGTEVVLERWGGDAPLHAQVRVVEPFGFTKYSALGVEEQRVLVIADITSPREHWEQLGDGYRVEAIFILWKEDDVLKIPNSALFRDGQGWATFVVEDTRAHHRPVEIGHRGSLATEVLSGLAAGETVIVHPDAAIADGSRVRVRSD